jgi:hypothetical protein
VQTFQGRKRVRKTVAKNTQPVSLVESEPLPAEVKALQRELRKAQLHNKLLNTMIALAEEQLGIPIRKKFGAKQS